MGAEHEVRDTAASEGCGAVLCCAVQVQSENMAFLTNLLDKLQGPAPQVGPLCAHAPIHSFPPHSQFSHVLMRPFTHALLLANLNAVPSLEAWFTHT